MILNMVGNGLPTKSTIIITAPTGSTVEAYSDSGYTTLVKTAVEKTSGQYWITGLNNGTYYLQASLGVDVTRISYSITQYGVYRITIVYRVIPAFTYSGTYQIVNDNNTVISNLDTYQGNWKIRFLNSGTLRFSNLHGARNGIDVFLVGGGGGGAGSVYQKVDTAYHALARPGGGGGYTTTGNTTVAINQDYTVTVGQGGAAGAGGSLNTANVAGGDGGSSSFRGLTAAGGKGAPGSNSGGNGGSGGGGMSGGFSAGGNGGSNGGNGGSSNPGIGQGTTTREFGASSGTLYAGGGGSGGHPWGSYSAGGAGGDGGGGHGGKTATAGSAGTANTGGGGGGGGGNSASAGYWAGAWNGGAGGTGIVIIRNHRT